MFNWASYNESLVRRGEIILDFGIIDGWYDVVNGRGTSTVTAIAYDSTTDKKIDNAVVKVKITFTSNDTSKEIVGHNGEATYSAEIKPNSKDNSNIGFRTTVQAFAPGYISTSKASSYLILIFYINNER